MSYIKSIDLGSVSLPRPDVTLRADRQPSFNLGLGSALLSTGLEALVGIASMAGVSLVLCTIAAAAFL